MIIDLLFIEGRHSGSDEANAEAPGSVISCEF